MQYGRSASVGEGSNGMTGGPRRHGNGSAGSSPDFAGGDYSTEYTDSPPDSTNRGPTYATHGAYTHTPPSLESSYPGAPGAPYHHPASYGGAAAANEGYGHAAEPPYANTTTSAGYVSYDHHHHDVRSSSYAMQSGGEYGAAAAAPNRGYSNGSSTSTWRSATYPFANSRPRHSNSPPLSPIDTRSASYFPPSSRDYPVSAVAAQQQQQQQQGQQGPSSPTTPSSVSDSPSTPFSPQYSSPPYHNHHSSSSHHHPSHSHSHSHSSSASASAYIHGTPLPPLQLSPATAGGHFVPPAGSEYPVPASANAYGYGRSSPPERIQSAQQIVSQPLAGAGYAARPFLCDDCGMNFARTHDLKRHQTTHVAGVKKTHPCPYCGKNLSRRDAIKRHVVSKQCPVATEKGYGWPPPEGHVPPLPDTPIERSSHKRGENPYPVISVSPDRGTNPGTYGYTNGNPTSPGGNGGPYSPNGYPYNGPSGPGGGGGYDHGAPALGPAPQAAGVVFDFDHRSSGYKAR